MIPLPLTLPIGVPAPPPKDDEKCPKNLLRQNF